MTSKPILFSSAMVRALLDGSKTQTRRIVKPQPTKLAGPDFDGCWSDTIPPVVRYFMCPFGRNGDTLWVRETWCIADDGVDYPFLYRADNWTECPSADGKWKPSIFMPRSASRITLEITAVRVERLNDISEEDAITEGVDIGNPPHEADQPLPTMLYERLWENINGHGSWQANPFVWVITFRRIGL